MTSYDRTISYLFGLQNRGVKLGLDRTVELMALIGNPYKSYPSVLIGGTNGKGSVSAMLASILREAGLRVGHYSSPHLVRFNERIRVDGGDIGDEELVDLTGRIRSILESAPAGTSPDKATFFEFATAIALSYFKERDVDIAILEVGLGGRLDSTNVVDPLLSVITHISLDHTSSLGESVREIAAEKAGIIRAQGAVVSSRQEAEAAAVIERVSRTRSAWLSIEGRDFSVQGDRATGELFNYRGLERDLEGLTVALNGPHQRLNAALALAAAEALGKEGFTISTLALREGLRKVEWPGRCELVGSEPSIIIDCAHNECAARALSVALEGFSYRRLILVLGVMADKDIDEILARLLPAADHVIITAPGVERAAKPAKILARVALADETVREAEIVEGVGEAISAAFARAAKEDMICITGSIFTVGEAMEFFDLPASGRPGAGQL